MKDKKKIWDASEYDKTSGLQIRDARETIEKFLEENMEELEVVLDIGCGSGHSTKYLSSQVAHKKIYAVDFDAQMISYANENHNDGTIEYFVQDIGLPWEKLDQRLKDLEGKVDLIWSNYCLHWVKEKATAAKTIGRLLKSGGRFYINAGLIKDMNEVATEEEEQENLKYLNIQSYQEQINKYTELFNNCGLKTVNTEMILKDWLFDSEEEFSQMIGSCASSYLALMWRENTSEEKRRELKARFEPQVLNLFRTKYGEKFKQMKTVEENRLYYEQLEIIGTK